MEGMHTCFLLPISRGCVTGGNTFLYVYSLFVHAKYKTLKIRRERERDMLAKVKM